MGHLSGPYYPHPLIQGFAHAHITMFALYAHITIFDIIIWLSTCTLVSNTESIRVYTDCAIICFHECLKCRCNRAQQSLHLSYNVIPISQKSLE